MLEEIRFEKEKLESDVKQLETNVYTLEEELRDAEDKLHLVIESPSVDSDVKHRAEGDLKIYGGEGVNQDVAQDMEKKVMANNIRIKTLEQQNEMLRKSIALLAETQNKASKKGVMLLLICL